MADRTVFVIAEAGVNHNGDVDRARRLIDAAAAAGADAVKFQTFRADRVVAADAPKAAYQQAATGVAETQYAMLQRLELGHTAHHALATHARAAGIAFLSTPFDADSARFLAREVGVQRLKVPSGEITNGPLLLEIARLGLPLILSTGASTLDEVADALGIIAFALIRPTDAVPDTDHLGDDRSAAAARLAERVTVLHCTTEYPAPAEDANLRAMATLAQAFGVETGLSDHSRGIALPIAATALGARVIEKHFTLDRTLPGPDHAASLEPGELAAMVAAIREVTAALGDGVKRPAPSEQANRSVVRRSLVATGDIAAGEVFTPDNLGARRPGTGESPMGYWRRLGTAASRAYRAGEAIGP